MIKDNMVYNNVLEMIGNTPLVRLNKLNKNKQVKIYVKLEGQNPGGSVKDRIALKMIVEAEKSGHLTKTKTILEPTSGNTGIGLAMVAAVKGYKTVLTMSAGMSEERKKVLRAYGAHLIETDPALGTDGAIKKAREILVSNPEKYWMPNQYDNLNNPMAHYLTTAEEIIKQTPDISAFVAGMGTSGTLMGVAKKLKEYRDDISIVGIEPSYGHKIMGLKNMRESVVPKVYDGAQLNEKIVVADGDAYKTARQLALKEGIFVGMSSGAAVYGAIEYAKRLKSGTIVVLLPDRGDRYTSTILFG